jgi:hypothetical protein
VLVKAMPGKTRQDAKLRTAFSCRQDRTLLVESYHMRWGFACYAVVVDCVVLHLPFQICEKVSW